jgi:guanine nucleotide-binding protein G(t) subunit alpha
MGICAQGGTETEADKIRKQKSKDLEKKMSNAKGADQQIKKLLLLGAGESGKSTLFKQMITIYGTGWPESKRAGYVSIIYDNILSTMKTILEQTPNFGPVDPDLEDAKKMIEELKGSEDIDVKIGETLKKLWADPGVTVTYDARAQYQLTDSCAYFLEKIDEVAAADYLPSEQDVLRSRVRTTGIVENEFIIDGNLFKMYDVGGQRNERKKWIHCFENVTAVLFVAAISAYDQKLFEDETQNRMMEALTLFDEICNSRWFQKTAMILMLNKRDLFEDKIKKVPLTVCFDDYDGDGSYEDGCDFVRCKFQDLNRWDDKEVYAHVTCATDTGNVTAVFDAVKDIVIRKSLADAGLV